MRGRHWIGRSLTAFFLTNTMDNINHYNVCFYLPTEGKTVEVKGTQVVAIKPAGYWKEIGRAFPNDKGQITIKLHALPIQPWDGKLRLFPVKADEQKS